LQGNRVHNFLHWPVYFVILSTYLNLN
jgi:hypothetical protein